MDVTGNTKSPQYFSRKMSLYGIENVYTFFTSKQKNRSIDIFARAGAELNKIDPYVAPKVVF